MGVSLTNGLSDLSKELGETNTNTTTRRIQHYNDAVIDFFNEKKFPFAVKKNIALTMGASNTLDITDISDMRQPGGIKEITISGYTKSFKPINYEDRNDYRYTGGQFFYIEPDQVTVKFTSDIDSGTAVTIYYYHIPARITDLESADTFPLPDRYRKVVATLAAAYVQWGRYLETQGNRLYNLYQKMVTGVEGQQAERVSGNPRNFGHYMKRIGFRRRYP